MYYFYIRYAIYYYLQQRGESALPKMKCIQEHILMTLYLQYVLT